MLKKLNYFIAIIIFTASTITLITQNFLIINFILVLLALMMFVTGLQEFKEDRKKAGWGYMIISLMPLSAVIQGWLLR